MLADRRVFSISAEAWTEFLAVLERPVVSKPALEQLLAEPSIFADQA